MTSLGQRILWRAVPTGVLTALIGYGLCRFYVSALQAMVSMSVDEQPDGGLQGPIVFGLLGFFLTAAVEFRRKDKAVPPARKTSIPVPAASH